MYLQTLALSLSALAAVTSATSPPPAIVPGSMSLSLPDYALTQLQGQVEAGAHSMPNDPVKSTCLTTCIPPTASTTVNVRYSSLSADGNRLLVVLQPLDLSFASPAPVESPCGRANYAVEIDPSALQPDSVMTLGLGDVSPTEGPFTGTLRLAMQAHFFPLDLGVPCQTPVLLELKLKGRWSTISPQPGFTPWSNLALTPNPVPPWLLHPECWESCPMPETDLLSPQCPSFRNTCLDTPPELGGTAP